MDPDGGEPVGVAMVDTRETKKTRNHFHFVREWFKEQLCQIQIELLAAVRMDKWSNGGGGCSFGSFAPDLDRLATNISINQ